MTSGLNLRQLEAFRATMHAGTVVAAAGLLNVTQPAVSRLIAELERRIGFALFERRGRRLVPTAEAQQLYREIERLQLGVERVAQVAADIKLRRAGALRLAVLPALAQWFAPRVATRFLSTRPDVTLFIDSLPSRQIADLVAIHQYDLGVVERPAPRPALEIEPFEGIETVAVLPARHRLAARDVIATRGSRNCSHAGASCPTSCWRRRSRRLPARWWRPGRASRWCPVWLPPPMRGATSPCGR